MKKNVLLLALAGVLALSCSSDDSGNNVTANDLTGTWILDAVRSDEDFDNEDLNNSINNLNAAIRILNAGGCTLLTFAFDTNGKGNVEDRLPGIMDVINVSSIVDLADFSFVFEEMIESMQDLIEGGDCPEPSLSEFDFSVENSQLSASPGVTIDLTLENEDILIIDVPGEAVAALYGENFASEEAIKGVLDGLGIQFVLKKQSNNTTLQSEEE